MAQICERLQCLCFGSQVQNTQSKNLKTIGILFAERVVHLSIECNFQNDSNYEKVIELIRHLTSLQKLKIFHFFPLNNVWNFVPKNLKYLYIWPGSQLGEDITSLISYIERNNRCLESLFIGVYRISEEEFDSICSHLDLKQLEINCEILSLNSLVPILGKSQPNLLNLTLVQLSIENSVLDSDRHYLKVRSLRLIDCRFEVKSFIQFLKLFRFLEKLEFNCLRFRCECNSTAFLYICEDCNQKCWTELSKSKTLISMTITLVIGNFSLNWHSLTRISNLAKLKVFSVSRDDSKELAQNLVEVLAMKTTKYFTLQFSRSNEKSVFLEELKHLCHEMPRNLRIIC